MAKSTDGIAFEENPMELERELAEIRNRFEGKREELIPMLQKVQAALGYLPEKALLEIARWSKLPAAAVFGAATFYTQFRFHPTGKHILRVCRGTACHVKGSDRILKDVETYLDIGPGETSRDRAFTLETVACFGSCALAPVVLLDSAVKGRMSSSKTREILREIQEKEDHPSEDPPQGER